MVLLVQSQQYDIIKYYVWNMRCILKKPVCASKQ